MLFLDSKVLMIDLFGLHSLKVVFPFFFFIAFLLQSQTQPKRVW